MGCGSKTAQNSKVRIPVWWQCRRESSQLACLTMVRSLYTYTYKHKNNKEYFELVNVIPAGKFVVRRCLEEGILNRKDVMLTSIIFYKRPFNASTRCSNSKYSPTFIVLPRTTHDPRSIREHPSDLIRNQNPLTTTNQSIGILITKS